MAERVWTARLRWRLRGATMWPAFLLALVVDTVLLRALPIAGALLAIGIVHHPVLAARARDFDVQAAAARAFVLERAPRRFAVNVDRMDTWKQGPRLYRSCVPGPTRRRSFCVFVDT